MVGDIHNGLVDPRAIVNQLDLILNSQNPLLDASHLFHSRRIHHAGFYRTRISLVFMFIKQREANTLTSLQSLDTRNLSHTHKFRAFPRSLSPTLLAAMQSIFAVVLCHLVVVLAIQVLDFPSGDTVRNSADGFAKVRAVVLFIVVGCGEGLDDVERAR